MIIERDVAVPVRGGVTVYADVFRPAGQEPVPPLLAWSPYGEHAGPRLPERYPDGGVAPGQLSPYTAFESPDPVHFWPYIGERWGFGTGRVEDLAAETAAHPFFDDFWASKAALP